VLHLASWSREVARRLHDRVARDPEDGDWPPFPGASRAGGRRWTGWPGRTGSCWPPWRRFPRANCPPVWAMNATVPWARGCLSR
jgi:hypothetical protein